MKKVDSAIKEGSDSYENISHHLVEAQNLATTHHCPGIVETAEITLTLGGDMVAMSTCMGLGGGFEGLGSHCIWCEVPRSQLHIFPCASQLRTLPRLYNLAHLPVPLHLLKKVEKQFPFQCPGCDRVISSEDVRPLVVLQECTYKC